VSPEPKAGEWLRQQIEELGALRNASVRDPQFKAWRQNTLTFIQRIWPGDTTKSERFRRVPFSPPSTRADARTIRDQFERGCGEALEYLNSLLVTLGEEKVAPGTTRAVPRDSERFEGDFPVVEMAGEPAPPAAAPDDAVIGDGPLLDLPDNAGPAAPRSTGPSRLPNAAIRPVAPEGLPEGFAGATPLDAPASAGGAGPEALPAPVAQSPAAPPAEGSRISVRGSGSAAPPQRPTNPLKDIFAPHRDAEDAPRPRNGKGRKSAKARLKDMLGLSSLDTNADPPEAHEARSAEPPVEEIPPARVPVVETPVERGRVEVTSKTSAAQAPVEEVPVVQPPVVEPPVEAATAPDPVEGHSHWPHPEFLSPIEALPPLTEDDVVPHEAESDSIPAAAGAPARASEPEPADSALVEDVDVFALRDSDASDDANEPAGREEAARAAAEFLDNSPVLQSAPRPVQRRGTPPVSARVTQVPSRDSAASQMLAIASEVDVLGIPVGHRARVRAALMDLARQLDEPEISWAALRDAVGFVMEFPPIARRVLPLLLPFLDIAA